jgi:hypothetical protein
VLQWITPTRFRRLVFDDAGGAGTGDGICAPPSVCATVTKTGLVATRSGIGNIHMPAIPAANCLLGQASGGLFASLQLFAAKVATQPTGSVVRPCIFHRVAPANSVEVERAAPQSILRSMHRREVGRGV